MSLNVNFGGFVWRQSGRLSAPHSSSRFGGSQDDATHASSSTTSPIINQHVTSGSRNFYFQRHISIKHTRKDITIEVYNREGLSIDTQAPLEAAGPSTHDNGPCLGPRPGPAFHTAVKNHRFVQSLINSPGVCGLPSLRKHMLGRTSWTMTS